MLCNKLQLSRFIFRLSDKAPRFSCSRPTSSNRDIGLPLATFYAARSGTAPPLLWPTFSPAHTRDAGTNSTLRQPRSCVILSSLSLVCTAAGSAGAGQRREPRPGFPAPRDVRDRKAEHH